MLTLLAHTLTKGSIAEYLFKKLRKLNFFDRTPVAPLSSSTAGRGDGDDRTPSAAGGVFMGGATPSVSSTSPSSADQAEKNNSIVSASALFSSPDSLVTASFGGRYFLYFGLTGGELVVVNRCYHIVTRVHVGGPNIHGGRDSRGGEAEGRRKERVIVDIKERGSVVMLVVEEKHMIVAEASNNNQQWGAGAASNTKPIVTKLRFFQLSNALVELGAALVQHEQEKRIGAHKYANMKLLKK